MKKVMIAALVITLALSATIISLKPTGEAVSSGNGEKEKITFTLPNHPKKKKKK